MIASLIGESKVESADVDTSTGDLSVRFANGRQPQVFHASSGYEAWQLYGPGTRGVICCGGGKVWEME